MTTAEIEGQSTIKVIGAFATHVTFLARAAVVRNLIPGQTQAHAVKTNTAVADGNLAFRHAGTAVSDFKPRAGSTIG